jgi:hypothetical protein
MPMPPLHHMDFASLSFPRTCILIHRAGHHAVATLSYDLSELVTLRLSLPHGGEELFGVHLCGRGLHRRTGDG